MGGKSLKRSWSAEEIEKILTKKIKEKERKKLIDALGEDSELEETVS